MVNEGVSDMVGREGGIQRGGVEEEGEEMEWG